MDLGVRELFVGGGNEATAETDETDGQVYHECRACGRAVDGDRGSCPACGGTVAGHLL